MPSTLKEESISATGAKSKPAIEADFVCCIMGLVLQELAPVPMALLLTFFFFYFLKLKGHSVS